MIINNGRKMKVYRHIIQQGVKEIIDDGTFKLEVKTI